MATEKEYGEFVATEKEYALKKKSTKFPLRILNEIRKIPDLKT